MPHSENDDYTLAIVAECLYLMNLLILPGVAFVLLGLLYLKYRHHTSAVVRCHLQQTFVASLWAGVMIVIISMIIVAIGGFDHAATWVVGILYFITIHAALVMLGALGLTRAINNNHFHYFLIGPKCHHD
jgi:Na+(H+)/acetate symporter ActP